MKFIVKIILFVSIFLISLDAKTAFPKEYYTLPITKQKEYFFNFFKDKIETENERILEDRAFIKALNNRKDLDENSTEYLKLQKLQEKYKVADIYDYSKFLGRVDIVSPSLALAQAAIESGWGKSRFFKEANNIFGQWTYNPKIGIVPLKRAKGKKHLIRIFPSLQDSIVAYMQNLNRTNAYKEFRKKRKQLREKGAVIDGLTLASTMTKYSGIGHNYVKMLESIIKKNNLVKLDKRLYEKIKNESMKEDK